MDSKAESVASNLEAQVSVWIKAAPSGLPPRKRLCVLTDQHLLFYKDTELQQLKGNFKLSSVTNVLHPTAGSATVILMNSSSWALNAWENLESEFDELLRKMLLAIVKMMGVLLEKDSEKVETAVQFINTLAQSEPNRDAILLAGALPALLNCLDGECKGVVAETLSVLARGSEERKMAIQYQGAIPALVKMLSSDARAEAARAIAALVHDSEQRKQIVFEDSAAVVDVFSSMLDGEDTEKEAAAWALGTLVVGNDERANVVRNSAVVSKLMDLLSKTKKESMQEGVCFALGNLAFRSPEVSESIRNGPGVLTALIACLRSDNQHLVDAAAMAVANISALSENFRNDFFDAEGLGTLVDLLVSHTPSAMHAATTVWNLSLSKKLQSALASEEIVAALKKTNPAFKQPHATGAMIAIGMFDLELPTPPPAQDNKPQITILAHPEQSDYVDSTLVPVANQFHFKCVVCVCASDTAEELVSAAQSIACSSVVIAALSDNFATSIECYTLMMYAMRIGKTILTCNVASGFEPAGWVRPFCSMFGCDVSDGQTEAFHDIMTDLANAHQEGEAEEAKGAVAKPGAE